ncbi:MAG: hypothetical protein Q7J05_05715 [Paludibacter sp.]|nr:hypothetical protein [Paludibacter sp.]
MVHRIITYSIAGLTVLLSTCVRPEGKKGNDVPSYSTWQLDEKSHQAIVNHCVEIDFTDSPAKFIMERNGDDLLLHFIGQHQVWMASANKRYFYATQVLKSSVSGRFCDYQTAISIYFRLTGCDQSKIKGIWRATSCDYCPKVEFIAYRIN